ncbi:MAG TPA: response regulator transcription factor [Candidatus Baltobacteraceae bacterium]|nr:response regulator transcription factor [Candidatus Baltobacteraceae bacterium]
MRVLIVEADTPLRLLVVRALTQQGHVVDALSNARDCAAYLEATAFDAVIFDLNLRSNDGLAILRGIRSKAILTPVLLLLDRGDVRDVVAGLDAGADDCLHKPFAVEELQARLRSLARRPRSWSEDLLHCNDLVFDKRTREARRGSRRIALTSKEIALLETLLRNAGRTVTRETLLDAVWDRSRDPESNVLDVYARRLRLKLSALGESPLLHTVRGVGYKLGPSP